MEVVPREINLDIKRLSRQKPYDLLISDDQHALDSGRLSINYSPGSDVLGGNGGLTLRIYPDELEDAVYACDVLNRIQAEKAGACVLALPAPWEDGFFGNITDVVYAKIGDSCQAYAYERSHVLLSTKDNEYHAAIPVPVLFGPGIETFPILLECFNECVGGEFRIMPRTRLWRYLQGYPCEFNMLDINRKGRKMLTGFSPGKIMNESVVNDPWCLAVEDFMLLFENFPAPGNLYTFEDWYDYIQQKADELFMQGDQHLLEWNVSRTLHSFVYGKRKIIP